MARFLALSTIWVAVLGAPGCTEQDGTVAFSPLEVGAFGEITPDGGTIEGQDVSVLVLPATVGAPAQLQISSTVPATEGRAGALETSTVASVQIDAGGALEQPILVTVRVGGDSVSNDGTVSYPFYTVACIQEDDADLVCDTMTFNDPDTGDLWVSFPADEGTFQVIELAPVGTFTATNDDNPQSPVVGSDETASSILRFQQDPVVVLATNQTSDRGAGMWCEAETVCGYYPAPDGPLDYLLDIADADPETIDAVVRLPVLRGGRSEGIELNGVDEVDDFIVHWPAEKPSGEGYASAEVFTDNYKIFAGGRTFNGCRMTVIYSAPLQSAPCHGDDDCDHEPDALVIDCETTGAMDAYLDDGACRLAVGCRDGLTVYSCDDGSVDRECKLDTGVADVATAEFGLELWCVSITEDGDVHFTDAQCNDEVIEGSYSGLVESHFEDGLPWFHLFNTTTNGAWEIIDTGNRPGGIGGEIPGPAGCTLSQVCGVETASGPLWVEVCEDGPIYVRTLFDRTLVCDDCPAPSDMDCNPDAVCVAGSTSGECTIIDTGDPGNRIVIATPGVERCTVFDCGGAEGCAPLLQRVDSEVEILTTNRDANTYRITVVDLVAGTVVRNNEYPLPAGCTGPVHAIRLPDGRVAVACPESAKIAILTPPE